MWYERDTGVKIPELDYSMPIVASGHSSGSLMILLPQIESGYVFRGYNWFVLDTGKYNSAQFFKTVAEAVNSYESYTIRNLEEKT